MLWAVFGAAQGDSSEEELSDAEGEEMCPAADEVDQGAQGGGGSRLDTAAIPTVAATHDGGGVVVQGAVAGAVARAASGGVEKVVDEGGVQGREVGITQKEAPAVQKMVADGADDDDDDFDPDTWRRQQKKLLRAQVSAAAARFWVLAAGPNAEALGSARAPKERGH